MSRMLFGMIGVLVPTVALAQGPIQITEGKVTDGKFVRTYTVMVPVSKTVVVEVEINGKRVPQTRTVTEYITQQQSSEIELKLIKATDGAGKEISTEKLVELLKAETLVVVVHAAVPEKHRKLFKESTVFVQLPAPRVPGAVGGAEPIPLPPEPVEAAVPPPVAVEVPVPPPPPTE